MKKDITIWLILSIAINSCSVNNQKVENQRKLINEILIPISHTRLYFQYNVQFQESQRVVSVVKYHKSDEENNLKEKRLYTFNNEGKIYKEFEISSDNNKESVNLLTEFGYDKFGRLSKIVNHIQKEKKSFIFTYTDNGLINIVRDENDSIQYKIEYQIDSDGLVDSFEFFYPEKIQTIKYEFTDHDLNGNHFTLKYIRGDKVEYEQMNFSFNINGTMKEVFGMKFTKTGVPIELYSAKGSYPIKNKIDNYGNWIEERIGEEQRITKREIKYR